MKFHLMSVGLISATALFGSMASPANAANIVVNGGFEDPGLPNPNSFVLQASIPGWDLAPGSVGRVIEVQRQNIAGTASEGNQFVELDSTNVTGIRQILDTVPGLSYFLRFDWSPRPSRSSGAPTTFENKLNITWNGMLVDSLVRQTTADTTTTDWVSYEYIVKATSNKTTLIFDNFGENQAGGATSFGSYLDNVSVAAVPTPALLPGLIGMGVAALRRKKSEEAAEENA